jgi:antiviral defense system Shedu protein SduA
MRGWSGRFEHGFSQLVDWAWRLAEEGGKSAAYQRIFGKADATIHLLLIAGRDADLSESDHARLRWRAKNCWFGAFRMTCLTFDGVLETLRRRLQIAQVSP